MDFEIWMKIGSLPYELVDLDRMINQTENPCILCENQEEYEILEGFQYLMGQEFDIRLIEPSSSVNPWAYNRAILFYTFNPIQRAGL